MIIKEIYISAFGKLKDFRLRFQEGANLIYGENEAGKSTIMAFILMAFYGGKSRQKSLIDNPRKKYRPWDGADMRGYIIFEKGGVEYRLNRTFLQTNRKDLVDLMDNISGEKISFDPGLEPGDYLFGMDINSFMSTIFVDSEDLYISSKQGLDVNERLLNMVSSSDETISYKKSRKILEDKKFGLISRDKKRGDLVDLQDRIKSKKRDLDKSIDLDRQRKEADRKLLRYEREIELEKLSTDYDKRVATKEEALAKNKINDERKRLENDLKLYNDKRAEIYSELDQIQLDLTSRRADKDRIEEELLKANERLKNYERQRKDLGDQRKSGSLRGFSLGGFLLFIAFAIIFFVSIYLSLPSIFLYVISGGLIVLLGYMIFHKLRSKRLLLENQEGYDLIDQSISNSSRMINSLDFRNEEVIKEINDLELRLKEKNLQANSFELMYEDKLKSLERLKDNRIFQSIDPRIIEADNKKTEDLLNQYKEEKRAYFDQYGSFLELEDQGTDRLLSLTKELAEKRGQLIQRFRSYDNPEKIREDIRLLEEEYRESYDYYESLDLAIDLLDRAYGQVSRDIGPMLNEKSQEIFKRLTAGSYDSLRIAKDLDISFEDGDQGIVKSWQYLSSGTRDQAYLSLRIAIAKVFYGNEKGILFLDDIFVKFDEQRASLGLKYIKNEADFQQILVFTCHKKIFDLAADFNRICLA